jgi:hypothetical protein
MCRVSPSHNRVCTLLCVGLAAVLWAAGEQRGCADDDFEREPINYSAATPQNEISRLQKRIDSGAQRLRI